MPAYIGFDMQPSRIQAARDVGFNVTYGDGSRASVVKAFAHGTEPCAFVVVYAARRRAVAAVENLRLAFPSTPIYARALDLRHAAELSLAGATHITTANTEAGTALGSQLLLDLKVAKETEVQPLVAALRRQMGARVLDLVAVQKGNSSHSNDDSAEDDSVFIVNETQWALRGARSGDETSSPSLKPMVPEGSTAAPARSHDAGERASAKADKAPVQDQEGDAVASAKS